MYVKKGLAGLLTIGLLAGAVVAPAAVAAQDDEIRIEVVSHGQASDPFWSVVQNGVQEAAADMGVTVNYTAPPTFDMVAMAQLIDTAVASQPDGLVISLPDADALGPSVEAAVAAGIPVVSMNSGSDTYADLGILTHVGQTEYEAGLGGGQRMAEAGVTKAICVNQDVGNVDWLFDAVMINPAGPDQRVVGLGQPLCFRFRALSAADVLDRYETKAGVGERLGVGCRIHEKSLVRCS